MTAFAQAAISDPDFLGVDPRMFAGVDEHVPPPGATLAGPGKSIGARIYVRRGDRFEEVRGYANVLPTYPGGGPQLTVDTALQMPNVIARALTDLAWQRFVADRIFSRGTADQVRGGAVIFQRAESIFPDRGAEQVGYRSEWPRSGWTVPDLFTAVVQKLGLEVPVADEAKRRNAMDQLARAQRKIANAVVKFVDGIAMTLLMTDASVNTYTAAATWGSGTPNILGDLVSARNLINNADLGYTADTLIIHPNQEMNLLTDATIRGILPRESTPRNAAITGEAVPLLGLNQILVTNQMTAGKGILLESGVVGSIADEIPAADEGYTTYDPGAGQGAIYVKRYRNENVDETILRGARFPAMWVAEPRAATVMNGI